MPDQPTHQCEFGFAADDDVPIPYLSRLRSYYQALGYGEPYRFAHYRDVPFTPLRKPLAQARVAIVTTAAPFQPDKGPQGPGAPYNASAKFYAVYSGDTSQEHDLRISHVGIDRKHATDGRAGCDADRGFGRLRVHPPHLVTERAALQAELNAADEKVRCVDHLAMIQRHQATLTLFERLLRKRVAPPDVVPVTHVQRQRNGFRLRTQQLAQLTQAPVGRRATGAPFGRVQLDKRSGRGTAAGFASGVRRGRERQRDSRGNRPDR